MKISYLANITSSSTVHEVASFDALRAGVLGAYDYRAQKDGPLISPAEFSGSDTKAESVVAVHFGAFDLDEITPAQWTEVLSRVEARGLRAFSYVTYSQPAASQVGLVRARLMLELSRPCSPVEWKAVWISIVSALGRSAFDEACKNVNRSYYLPSLPLGCEAFAQSWSSPGELAWDVEAGLRESHAPDAPSQAIAGSQPIPRDALTRLAAKLQRSDRGEDLAVGQMLRSALDGHAFAPSGARHLAKRSLTMRIAMQFPFGNAIQIAEHFRQALDLMRDGTETEEPFDKFVGLLESAQAKVQEDRQTRESAGYALQQNNLTVAWQGQGHDRGTPYTPYELNAACARLRCPSLDKRWIVQKGELFYVLFLDPVRGPIYLEPVSRSAVSTSIEQNLAPASTAGVSTNSRNERGEPEPKTLDQLVAQYGRTVSFSEMSMLAPCTYLSPLESTIVEACATLRILPAEYDEEIDEWLTLLAGDSAPETIASRAKPGTKAARLCDWLATVTELDKPAPALFLKGEAGVGKGLFADGLARLWGSDRPTSLQQAMGTFNQAITRCPLVLGDERIPETFKGEPRTEELRELITTRVFELNRKNRDVITCHGALRIILAANNFGMISRRAELTPEDALALADRFILIEPSPLARDYLIQKGGPVWGETVVMEDRLAKHAHWLREQSEIYQALGTDIRAGAASGRHVLRGTRLAVPGDAHVLADALQSASRTPWAIMRWLWSFLKKPETHLSMSAGRPFAAVVARGDNLPVGAASPGELWVCRERLVECWDHYLSGERVPSREQLAGALRALLEAKETGGRLRRGKGGATAYYRVRLEVVLQWARQNGEDVDDLNEWLTRETEKIGALAPAGLRVN